MKQIKLNLPEDQIALLDRTAKEQGTTRAELIRQRIAGNAPGGALTLDDYQQLITKVVRTSGVSLPRPQVETLVATVIKAVNPTVTVT